MREMRVIRVIRKGRELRGARQQEVEEEPGALSGAVWQGGRVTSSRSDDRQTTALPQKTPKSAPCDRC